MPITPRGTLGTDAEVEANTRALRIVQHPIDFSGFAGQGASGAYAINMGTGVIAAGMAAAAPIFAFRHTNYITSSVVRIQKVDIIMSINTTAFTAGLGIFEMVLARNWLVADSTGLVGTVVAQRRRTAAQFGLNLGDYRLANTGALTAGIRTLDAQPVGSLVFTVPAVTTSALAGSGTLYQQGTDDEVPITLGVFDGFIIRGTVPATGTWTASITCKWTETLRN